MRNFKDELQELLEVQGTSWAEAADKLGKERNNVRRNTRRWVTLAEDVLNVLGYTMKFEKLARKVTVARKPAKVVKKKAVKKKAIKKAVIKSAKKPIKKGVTKTKRRK